MSLPFPDPPTETDFEEFVVGFNGLTEDQKRDGLDYMASHYVFIMNLIKSKRVESSLERKRILDFNIMYWFVEDSWWMHWDEFVKKIQQIERSNIDSAFVARWFFLFTDTYWRGRKVTLDINGNVEQFGFGDMIKFGDFLDRYCPRLTREIVGQKLLAAFRTKPKDPRSRIDHFPLELVLKVKSFLLPTATTRRATAADSHELNHWIRVLDNDDGGDATVLAISLRNLDTELRDPLITTREKIYDAVRRNQDKFTGTNGQRPVRMLHGEPNESGTTLVQIKYVVAVLPRINNILVADQMMGFVKSPRPTRRAPISRLGLPVFARVAGMLYYPTDYAPIPIDRFAKSEQDAEREDRARRRIQQIRRR